MRLLDHADIHPTAMVSEHAHYYGSGKVKIGQQARVDHGAILTGDVELGRNVHLAAYVSVFGKYGVTIGDYTGLSAFTVVLSASDDFSGRSMFGPTIPDEYKPFLKTGHVRIGKNCIIGTHCTVCPGVSIADGVSIGAHSLIDEDCAANNLYAGAPATLRKSRSMDIWKLNESFESVA